IANGLAWNLEPQLFPALFLIGDCYIQTEIYPFEFVNTQVNFSESQPLVLMRKGGLEPPHLTVPDPKSGASANSATFAMWNMKDSRWRSTIATSSPISFGVVKCRQDCDARSAASSLLI